MCPKIIIDNHKKIYLDNCYKPCTYYVSNGCSKKYIEVDNCCSKKYIKVDNCCSKKFIEVDDCCSKKYIEVDDCCSKKYIEVDNCCSKKYIKVHKHEYDKKIYYCKCCDKYKIKKVKKCCC